MKKLILSAGLLLSLPVWSADIALEGVTILGKNKTAYLLIDGEKRDVKIGDLVGEWEVTDITPRAVQLRKADGTEQEIGLHSQESMEAPAEPAVETAPPPMTPENNPFAKALEEAAKNGNMDQPEPPDPTQRFQPRHIPDDQIPAGHRRVRTPFGDIVVPEQQAAPPSGDAPAPGQ